MRRIAIVGAGLAAGLAATLIGSLSARAQSFETARQVESEIPEPVARPPHFLWHYYLSGVACLVRGDPAGAAAVFAVTDHITTDLPQMHYLLALARVLSDFDRRGSVLTLIEKAIAQEPGNPLYAILEVLANAKLSTLKPDGALYLTPAGAHLLRAAASRLTATKEAYNGKYFALLADAIEETGDPMLPRRWNGFTALLGPGATISLPGIKEPQALGRLLVLAITESQLAPYEARFLGNPSDGLRAGSPGIAGPAARRSYAGNRSVLSP